MRYSLYKREYPKIHTGTSTPYSTKKTLKYNPLEGRVYSLCLLRFTQVYDVNESVYQVYSKFRIQNSEFEFRIRNSEL